MTINVAEAQKYQFSSYFQFVCPQFFDTDLKTWYVDHMQHVYIWGLTFLKWRVANTCLEHDEEKNELLFPYADEGDNDKK